MLPNNIVIAIFCGSEVLCRDNIVTEFDEFIKVALEYIQQKTEENITLNFLEKLNLFSLEDNVFPSYDSFIDIIDCLSLVNTDTYGINCDALFNEVTSADEIYKAVYKLDDFNKLSCSAKWCNILKSGEFPNLYRFISFFLSIPSSSAFSERVFSVMNLKWRDERNRACPELIKAELLIYFNNRLNCIDFFKSIKNDKRLLHCAKSNEKYIFKKIDYR